MRHRPPSRTNRGPGLWLFVIAGTLLWPTQAAGQHRIGLMDAPCTGSPDALVTESETGRQYYLDYPCDLRSGEDVTLVLSLHGGGSSHNWQRRYFPAFDWKEAHRLVIATPFSPTRRWSEVDDAYLRNIVTDVVEAVGREHVRSFWLAGHSQGGSTSRPHRLHGLLPHQGRRFPESLGRSPGRRGAPLPQRRSAAPGGRPAPGPECTAAPAADRPARSRLRLLPHLRDRRTRDHLAPDGLLASGPLWLRHAYPTERRRRRRARLRARRRPSEPGHSGVGPPAETRQRPGLRLPELPGRQGRRRRRPRGQRPHGGAGAERDP